MKKRLIFSFIFFVNLVLWISCSTPVDEGFISEGLITYNAEVVDTESPMASMAPSKMKIKFKDNKSSAEMSAGMGLLTTSFISEPETKTFTQLIRFMDKKYSVIQNAAEIKKENELFNLEVIPTKETKIIAGYKCKKVIIHYRGGDPLDYPVYYTTDLNIKNPNFANPYYMIDGVLMEYKIKKFGLEMKFTAESVTKEEIENATFELPNDYKQISMEEMTDLFIDFQ
jgi:hypothetical protein